MTHRRIREADPVGGPTVLIENWTLTCEKGGQVLQQVPVIIDRGEQSKIDLSTCINRSRNLR